MKMRNRASGFQPGTAEGKIPIRKATVVDADRIHYLVNQAAMSGAVLPRTKDNVYEFIRDFFVFESEGNILGTAALHVTVQDLAEIRSLVVEPEFGRRSIGTRLVRSCLTEAHDLELKSVFVLTYAPEFFRRFGFEVTDKKMFPHKIWMDCAKCHKYLDCDEVALIYSLEGQEKSGEYFRS